MTRAAAETLAAAAKADLFEIRPETPYTAADLDWTNKNSRSTLEMQDLSCRPALVADQPKMDEYDVIFIGFPIWWGREPSIIDSFAQAQNFIGKRVIPFCTSGGGGFANRAQLEKLIPGVEAHRELGKGAREADVKAWLAELAL
ncbi:MAG: NAD(P)H-dependent oxidoreductase [Clostridia bacterium]|nr:NAD(P)H-dependent oxidoreductase [Clostridia bacterium]